MARNLSGSPSAGPACISMISASGHGRSRGNSRGDKILTIRRKHTNAESAGWMGMSRGRPPRKACREACTSAAQRGMVLDAAGMAGSHFDFILFVREWVTFVRVKRSHSRIISPREPAILCSAEIAGLRKVPQTSAVSRELWILLPWGSWQYFCIGDDSVTEIHDDSGKIFDKQVDSARVRDRRDPVPP